MARRNKYDVLVILTNNAAILWKEVRESKNEKVYSKQLLNKYRYKIEEYHK